ncbi:hypothetical protein ACFWOX_03825 [Streptomyces sp. NPDC058467]|uniref:hypothetical protein n=1 Tax=unclassified Streptomyces TaxID=2593676 RepID=UPI00365606D2
MFSRKKIAALSGLLCGLAVTCAGAGAAQAYAAGGPGTCTVDLEGNVTCVQRIVGAMPAMRDGGDGLAFRQAQSCVPTKPFSLPVIPVLNNGSTRIGPEVTCAPDAAPGADNSDDSDKGPLALGGLLG